MSNEETVGIVLVGTLFALSHAQADVMKPRLLSKCVEGAIIFHPEADNGISSHPETWLVAYESSEVIFFSRKNFATMWNEQRMMTSQQIIISSL